MNDKSRKRLKQIDEEIYELLFKKNHSGYKSNKCPYCDKWEKLVIERNKLFSGILNGR